MLHTSCYVKSTLSLQHVLIHLHGNHQGVLFQNMQSGIVYYKIPVSILQTCCLIMIILLFAQVIRLLGTETRVLLKNGICLVSTIF